MAGSETDNCDDDQMVTTTTTASSQSPSTGLSTSTDEIHIPNTGSSAIATDGYDDDPLQLFSPTPAAAHDGGDTTAAPREEEKFTHLNDDELKDIVSAISPDLSALLSEEALDSFLDSSAVDDDDDDGGGSSNSPRKRRASKGRKSSDNDDEDDDNDNDSVDHELLRLAAAEDSLREELDMVGGLGDLMSSPIRDTRTVHVVTERIVERERIIDGRRENEGEEAVAAATAAAEVVAKVDDVRDKGSLLDGGDGGDAPQSPPERRRMSSRTSTGTNSRPPSTPVAAAEGVAPSSSPQPRVPVQYTHADHAVHLSVQALPADMGCVSVPLLSRNDVEDMFPPFNPNMMSEFDPTGGSDGSGNLVSDLDGEVGADADADAGDGESESDDDDGSGKASGLAGAYEDLVSSTTGSTTPPQKLNASTSGQEQKQEGGEATAAAVKEDDEEREEFITTTQNCFREYIRPVPPGMLRKMFAGLVEPIDTDGRTFTYINEVGGESAPGASANNRPERQNEAAPSDDNMQGGNSSSHAGNDQADISRPANPEPVRPVRTVTIRIRPDVLCGAVMDAISTAVTDVGGEITKRRGGHLRCAVPGYWLGRGTRSRQTSSNQLDGMAIGNLDGGATGTTSAHNVMAAPSSSSSADAHLSSSFSRLLSPLSSSSKAHGSLGSRKRSILLPPIIADVQLITRKLTRDCERILLVRIYRSQDPTLTGSALDGDGLGASGHLDYVSVDVDNMGMDISHHGMTDCPINEWGGILLKEAASLVQKMEEHKDTSFGEVFNGGRTPHQGRNAQISAAVVKETVGVSLPPTPSDIADNYSPPPEGKAASGNSTTGKYVKALGSMLTSPFRSPLSGSSSNINRAGGGEASGGMYPDQRSATEGASIILRRSFHPTLSVIQIANQGNRKATTIPSLSSDDYAYVQSSWRFLQEILSELDSRTLSYPTLSSYSFGAFPSLPTVDVHYCSQLRLVSRENMILSLIKMANELEGYAREAEYSTANLIQILRVTYSDYKMDEPALPKPSPLSAYPLDFEPHEAACPPWGMKVMEALNRVAASSSPGGEGTVIDPNDISLRKARGESRSAAGYRAARDAVALVASAFQRQADEEQAARMGRKNVQVLDRLAKMQAHKRLTVLTLRGAYGKNVIATKAADELNRRIEKYGPKKDMEDEDAEEIKGPSLLSFFTPVDRVPLLKCGIAIGATSSGICYITANEFVCITQVIPLLGGKTFYSVPITDVELKVNEAATSLMNPLASESITVHDLRTSEDGGSANDFTFVPALAAKRFKAFVGVVKDVMTEDPETLKFSVRGGLMYASNDTQKEPVLLSRPEKQKTVKNDTYASML